MLSSIDLDALSRRDRLLIPACILLTTALAWAYLIHLGRGVAAGAEYDRMMAAMGMSTNKPWTVTDLFFTFAMWAVMMIGMMGPAGAPVLMLFAAAAAKQGRDRAPGMTLVFGLGYVAVWSVFSVGAAATQGALQRAAVLSTALSISSRWVAGTILLGAGVYQLSPWKDQCLAHSRSPLGFFLSHWRAGRTGAFRMGFRHGLYCLGCCWALMCVLFAVGVMNLVWVAALTGLVLLEKTGPAGVAAARVGGAAMVVWGIVQIVHG